MDPILSFIDSFRLRSLANWFFPGIYCSCHLGTWLIRFGERANKNIEGVCVGTDFVDHANTN